MSSIIDLCQLVFRKFVGLDTFYITYVEGQATAVEDTDILFELVKSIFIEGRHPALYTTFWSIIILSIILLFITTLAGILRSEYTQDKEKLNSKSGVIKNAGKALASFVLIPITCYVCIFMGNAIIRAVDSATTSAQTAQVYDIATTGGIVPWDLTKKEPSKNDVDKPEEVVKTSYMAYAVFGINIPTTFTPFSSLLFRGCCYNANKVRNTPDFFENVILHEDSGDLTSNFGVFNTVDSPNLAANLIDEAFMINARLSEDNKARLNHGIENNLYSWTFMTENGVVESFSMYNVGLVSYYYDLVKFDFITAYIAGIAILKVMLALSIGVIKRLILCLAYFFVMPIFLSFMPVDNGESFKNWRKHFTGAVISAYVPILAMNIFYLVFPVLNEFRFFPESMWGATALNYIITTAILVASVQSLETISADFSKMIGGIQAFDMFASGKKGLEEVGTQLMKGKQMATKAVGLATGGAMLAAGAAMKGIGAVGKGAGAGLKKFGNYIDEKKNRFNDDDRQTAQNNALQTAQQQTQQDLIDRGNRGEQFSEDTSYDDRYINSLLGDDSSRQDALNDYLAVNQQNHQKYGDALVNADDVTDGDLRSFLQNRMTTDRSILEDNGQNYTDEEFEQAFERMGAYETFAKNTFMQERQSAYYDSAYKEEVKQIKRQNKESGVSAQRAQQNKTVAGKIFRGAGTAVGATGKASSYTGDGILKNREKVNDAVKDSVGKDDKRIKAWKDSFK